MQPYVIHIPQPEEYEHLESIWLRAVLATHDFLDAGYRKYIQERLQKDFFPAVNLVAVYFATEMRQDNKKALGFMGFTPPKLQGKNTFTMVEMLFIAPDFHGQGLGRLLLDYAKSAFGTLCVDVNEANIQALGFYKHYGFMVKGRSEIDSLGKPYPLLHLCLG